MKHTFGLSENGKRLSGGVMQNVRWRFLSFCQNSIFDFKPVFSRPVRSFRVMPGIIWDGAAYLLLPL